MRFLVPFLSLPFADFALIVVFPLLNTVQSVHGYFYRLITIRYNLDQKVVVRHAR